MPVMENQTDKKIVNEMNLRILQGCRGVIANIMFLQ